MIKHYIKKPITIEAIQFDGTPENVNEIERFMKGINYHVSIEEAVNFNKPAILMTKNELKQPVQITYTKIIIHTLEGDMTASVGDYIIKGIKDEYYPCKPDIFKDTYNEVIESTKPILTKTELIDTLTHTRIAGNRNCGKRIYLNTINKLIDIINQYY